MLRISDVAMDRDGEAVVYSVSGATHGHLSELFTALGTRF